MKRKRIFCITLAVIFILSLTGCRRQQTPVVLYDNDGLQIVRQGAKISVTDTENGGTYTFTARRAKRTDSAREATSAVDNGNLQIEYAYDLIRIARYDQQGAVYVKVRR